MDPIEEDTVVARVAPIIRIAHWIVERAIDENATEIQVVPVGDKIDVCYRINGVLHHSLRLPPRLYPNLVTRYKVMAEVSWAARHQPARGRFFVRRRGRYYEIDGTFPLRLLEPKITLSIAAGVDAEGEDEDQPI